MGAGIIRGQKVKAESLKGIEIHVSRSRKSKSNLDIDEEMTKKNFCLGGLDAGNLNQRVNDRIAELPGQKTKTGKIRKIQNNAVRMYDFIVTASHEEMMRLGDDGAKAYFQDTLDWMCERFGKDNIMYAVVHMDERTPHMHIGLVPEYKGKLGANLLFTPQSMRSLQDDFFEQVSSKYGLERGDVGSNKKHESAVELKSRTLREVDELQEQLGQMILKRVELSQENERRQEEMERRFHELRSKILRLRKEEQETENRMNEQAEVAASVEKRLKKMLLLLENAKDAGTVKGFRLAIGELCKELKYQIRQPDYYELRSGGRGGRR